jgi:hypothetical protein
MLHDHTPLTALAHCTEKPLPTEQTPHHLTLRRGGQEHRKPIARNHEEENAIAAPRYLPHHWGCQHRCAREGRHPPTRS